jgi:hypothetical protein
VLEFLNRPRKEIEEIQIGTEKSNYPSFQTMALKTPSKNS